MVVPIKIEIPLVAIFASLDRGLVGGSLKKPQASATRASAVAQASAAAVLADERSAAAVLTPTTSGNRFG